MMKTVIFNIHTLGIGEINQKDYYSPEHKLDRQIALTDIEKKRKIFLHFI